MKKLIRFKDALLHSGAIVAGFAVVAMMILTCLDVFSRNVLHNTISGAYETTQYILMPLAIFLALPAAYDAGIMPRVGDLIDKAPQKLRKFVEWTVFIIELIIYFLLSYCSIRFFINGVTKHNGVTMGGKVVATYPVYIVLPIGFICVLVLIVFKIIRHVTKTEDIEKTESKDGK